MEQKSPKKKLLKIVLFVFLGLIVLGATGAAGFIIGTIVGAFGGTGDSAVSYLDETLTETQQSDAAELGYLKLVGEIVDDATAENPQASLENLIAPAQVRQLVNQMRESEPNLKAIIIQIDSPGGLVSPSDELARTLSNINQEIPIYVYSSDILASGGYYLAAGVTKIFASPNALVGSIGVIGQLPNIEGLADKLGVKMETIKSGRLKDAGDPFRELTAEERTLFQELADEEYEHFITTVATGRNMPVEEVRELATGWVWHSEKAKEFGLIDEVLYQDEVVSKVKEIHNITDDVTVVQYALPPGGFFDQFGFGFKKLFGQNDPLKDLADRYLRAPGLYYLYLGV